MSSSQVRSSNAYVLFYELATSSRMWLWNGQVLDKINPFAAVELHIGQGLHAWRTMGLYPRPINQGQRHTGIKLWSWLVKWSEAWDEFYSKLRLSFTIRAPPSITPLERGCAALEMDLTNWNGQRQTEKHELLPLLNEQDCVCVCVCVCVWFCVCTCQSADWYLRTLCTV